jgi:hypothetical protein
MFVSTVVPCVANGAGTSTTVTHTDQVVTLTHTTVTATSTSPSLGLSARHGPQKRGSLFKTVLKEYSAPYNRIGPLALDDYDGTGLCRECENADGSLEQYFDVKECHVFLLILKDCIEYVEKRVSPAATTSTFRGDCQTQFFAPSAGVYTLTCSESLSPATVTAGSYTTTIPRTWGAVTTTSCRGPTTFKFKTTASGAIAWTPPVATYTSGQYVIPVSMLII